MNKYLIITGICLVLVGCSSFNLGRDIVAPDSVTGSYNLILVGGTFGADAERIVILDVETDGYSFRPVTGPGRVKNFPGMSGEAALKKAEDFFSSHCAYNGFLVKEMKLPDGSFIGYELTPDYPVALCEEGNVLSVSYGMGEGGEIKVYTWLHLKEEDGGSNNFPVREK
ncbi:MAG: hypothetical protein ABFS18_06025 [Thermodesulfobacteriota bacterium]